jgi:V-type H+-transporting ATPase subunit H
MTFQLQHDQQHIVDLNIQILDALFHIAEYRQAFYQTPHAIHSLANVLKLAHENHLGPQKVYEISFAIWLLTFDTEIAKQLDK